jgi:hypothetical protein
MEALTARTILDAALLQSAAECYLQNVDLSDSQGIRNLLMIGANDPAKQNQPDDAPLLASATRFTEAQAKWFTDNYTIVTHYPNDASGFSCTLFRENKENGEFILSFRSTEYQMQDKGGDYERDGSDATDGDISVHGFGMAQIASMEKFYENLKQGEAK